MTEKIIEENDPQIEEYNKLAFLFLKDPQNQYGDLCREPFWKKAKQYVIDKMGWEIVGDRFICMNCHQILPMSASHMHHFKYKWKSLFDPATLGLVCARCHYIIHKKEHKWVKNNNKTEKVIVK
jgi:hypothetical protein